jgi:lactobin A/cerein 7B family class IIb bacteriocin
MNEKFNSINCEALSQKELQDVNGGMILFLMAYSAAVIGLAGLAIYGAYQMGHDKACGC